MRLTFTNTSWATVSESSQWHAISALRRQLEEHASEKYVRSSPASLSEVLVYLGHDDVFAVVGFVRSGPWGCKQERTILWVQSLCPNQSSPCLRTTQGDSPIILSFTRSPISFIHVLTRWRSLGSGQVAPCRVVDRSFLMYALRRSASYLGRGTGD